MSTSGATLSVAGAWAAFVTGLIAGGEVRDAGSFAIWTLVGLALAMLGFSASSRCRTLPRRVPPAQLALRAIAAGTALGIANLMANRAIAAAHPQLRALLVERVSAIVPLHALVAAPLVEEVAFRFFLMSVMAWSAFRVMRPATPAVAVALLGSALAFALLHLARPLPGDPAVANLYRTALVTKYTLLALPLGWIFWRWGLPYAILCHSSANAAHWVAQRWFF